MKAFHRICGIILALLFLYIGVTGSLIEAIDLRALLKHTPATDPTMLSIRAGMYGEDNNHQVMTAGDFAAAPIPLQLDYRQALGTVLKSIHEQVAEVAPRFVELRVSNGKTIGQARVDDKILAFDATSGAPVAATDVAAIGKRPPPSLRVTLKRFHRFWFTNEFPGVWIQLVGGLILCAIIVTGLVMYFRLLAERAKLNQRQLLWSGDGWWRSAHRAISVLASVFLLAVAFSGAWIGFDSVIHSVFNPHRNVPDADLSAPLSDTEVQQMAVATLSALHQREPQTSIRVLRLRVFGPMKQGVVITGDDEARQLVFNTETGKPASLDEPGYPNSGFPFGLQKHEDIKYFHSGYFIGLTGQWLGLFAGLSLVFLSISGAVVYVNLWRQRPK